MDAIVELSWRGYPALAMGAIGVALALSGVRFASRGLGDPERNLRFVRGFRLTVIGLALISIGAAWQWHIGWLLVLALAIGFEETLESSIHAFAIRRGIRLDAERVGRAS